MVSCTAHRLLCTSAGQAFSAQVAQEDGEGGALFREGDAYSVLYLQF